MRRPREVGFEVAPGLMGLSNIGIVFGHVGDLLLLARLALEAAIPNENVLIELLSPDLAAMSALPRRAEVVSEARHVREGQILFSNSGSGCQALQ